MHDVMIRRNGRLGASARPAARSVLMVATALGWSLSVFVAAAPERALASGECGAIQSVGTGQDQVTCTGAGNPYGQGVSYSEPNPNDLTVVLQGTSSSNPVDITTNTSSLYNGVQVTGATTGQALTINLLSGATVTASGDGIDATGYGAGAVTVNNAASVSAVGNGIWASARTGGVTITNSGAVTIANAGSTAFATAILGNSTGGAESVTNSGALTVTAAGSTDASGISLKGNSGAQAIYNNQGGAITVSTGFGAAVGIQAAYGNGIGPQPIPSVTIVNNDALKISSTNGSAVGIQVGHEKYGAMATTVTNNGAITVTGATSAIGIQVGGENVPGETATVTNTAAISATATGATGTAIGIQVGAQNGGFPEYNHAGSVTVDLSGAGNVTATGYSATGVWVLADNTVHISGSGSTLIGAYSSGGGGAGVYANSAKGSTYVNVNKVATTGDNTPGLNVSGYSSASVTVNNVSTTGNNSPAVEVTSSNGAAYANVGQASTTGANSPGVVIQTGSGPASVVVSGPISTSGAYSPGVVATSQTGTVSVTGAGAVSATGPDAIGVAAEGGAGVTVNLSGPVTATGAGASEGVGVAAISQGGPVSVTVGSVTSYNTGVVAVSALGDASVTVNGAVKASNKYGVLAVAGVGGGPSGTANASVTVNPQGAVSGSVGALAIATGAASVTNSGTITGVTGGANAGKYSHVPAGVAVAAVSYGAAAVVNNNAGGVINGPVLISGYTGSTFNNAGVWNVVGTSYIGTTGMNGVGGVVNNSGEVNVAPTATSPTTVTISNVSTWNNSGRISLLNGHTGDVLNLGGAAFVGSGVSSLIVDADLSAGMTSDKLVVGAASGSTTVLVHDVSPSAPAQMIFSGGPVVVQATSGTASTFTMAPTHKGFVNYALNFDPTAVTWSLVGLPDHAAFETLKLAQLSQAFASRSDDVWYLRMQEIRDALAQGKRQNGFEVWGQVYGGSQDLGGAQSFSVSGFSFNENLGTKSSWAGLQAGVDYLSDWKGGKLLWGVTAGYLQQSTTFATGDSASWTGGKLVEAGGFADSLGLQGANLGTYVGYTRGGWFLNGMAKADFIDDGIHLNSAPTQASTNSTVWGLKGEAGYRLETKDLFLEPVIRLAGGDTDVDHWSALGASMSYPDATNLQVQAGARVGGQAGWGRLQISPWMGAYWVDETLGRNREQFATGTQAIELEDTPPHEYARFELGATAKSAYGLEGYARVSTDTGTGVTGWSGDVGLRWRW